MLPLPVIPAAPPTGEGPYVVDIKFKGNRREFFLTSDASLAVNDYVIVEVERGEDLGRVRSVGGIAAKKCGSCGSQENDAAPPPERRIARRAETAEVQQLMVLRAD